MKCQIYVNTKLALKLVYYCQFFCACKNFDCIISHFVFLAKFLHLNTKVYYSEAIFAGSLQSAYSLIGVPIRFGERVVGTP